MIQSMINETLMGASSYTEDLAASMSDYWLAFSADYSRFQLMVLGTFIVFFLTYWIQSSLLAIMDFTQKPAFLYRYKIQPEENAPMDMQKFKKAIKQVVINQFLVHLPFAAVVFTLVDKYTGMRYHAPLPSLFEVAWNFAVFAIVEETGFYYAHRLFHSKALYKRFHKIHHEWTAPIGFVCIYAHPLEHILANLAPILMGPIIAQSHIVTMYIWVWYAVSTTIFSHCGYHFPLHLSPEAHDYHHLKFNQNFGVLGLLDSFHGTNKQFLASLQYENHKKMFFVDPLPTAPKNSKRAKAE